MKRMEFIRILGGSCLAFTGAPVLLSRCVSVHHVNSQMSDKTLTLSRSEFVFHRKNQKRSRDLVLVISPSLPFPVAVYKGPGDEYTALWLECTHQGCEVNAQPGYLDCPCHGSEFDAKGQVIQGPAEENLRTFNVTTDEENIYIHL